MIFNYRLATCHYPRVRGITIMVNSLFNGWRFEDAWLDH
jgi:peptide/nickel transport system substrate-binding protein